MVCHKEPSWPAYGALRPLQGAWCILRSSPLTDSQPSDVERVVQVDLLGTIACAQAFLPQLVASGHGQRYVFSAFGLIGVPG